MKYNQDPLYLIFFNLSLVKYTIKFIVFNKNLSKKLSSWIILTEGFKGKTERRTAEQECTEYNWGKSVISPKPHEDSSTRFDVYRGPQRMQILIAANP
ncbi:MAG: hypothetical protein LBS83_03275 [Holosporales bacterium]|nr:hypothetical protein [Holosporales bacterium]